MLNGVIIDMETTYSLGDNGMCEDNIITIQSNNQQYTVSISSIDYRELFIGSKIQFSFYRDRIDQIVFQ
jgi:hypothetical protein